MWFIIQIRGLDKSNFMSINAPLVFNDKRNTMQNTGKIMTSVNPLDKIIASLKSTGFIFHSKTLSIAPAFAKLYFCAAVNYIQSCENTEAFLLQ